METVLLQASHDSGVTILSIEGDASDTCNDIARLDPVLQGIPRTEETWLVIDLSKIAAVGCKAVAKLLWVAINVRKAGGDIALAAVPQHIYDLLHALRVDGMIDIYKTVDEAVAAVRGDV